MEIKVKVVTILLKKAAPPLESSEFTFSSEGPIDIDGLINALGIPPTLVGSVTVNSKRSKRDRRLADGDRVAIIPAISGG